MEVFGVDLSDYQQVESFHALQGAGIGFVVAKATQGTGNVQQTFADYRDRVRSIGLVFGSYHFLEWHVDPVAQADHFLSVYKPQAGDLPPTLDCEACTVDSATAAAHVHAFISRVEDAMANAGLVACDGSRALCLLYMSYSFPADHLGGDSGLSGHPLWIAAYENLDKGFADVVPPGWTIDKVKLWQYSDGAHEPALPGISNPVDRDVFQGSPDALRAFTLRSVQQSHDTREADFRDDHLIGHP